MAYTLNGPRAGRGVGRSRFTLVNNASKKKNPYPGNTASARTPVNSGAVPPPPVDPSSAVAYGGQLASLQLTLGARLAELRAQRGFVQGQFRMDRAGIRANRISGIAGAVGGAIESGILGGSADLEQRVGVESDAAAQMQAAIQAKLQGILGIKMGRIQATNEYYTGVYQVQAAKAAQQAELANQAFLQDLVMRLGDETAPGVTSGAATAPQKPKTPQAQATLEYIRQRIAAGRM